MQNSSAKFIYNEGLYSLSEERKVSKTLHSENKSNREKLALQSTVIVVSYKEESFIPKGEKDLLEKIMIASRKTSTDYTIVGTNQFIELSNQIDRVENLILFGPHPTDIKINGAHIVKYELQKIKNTNILFADDLKGLNSKKDAKQALWLGLKRLYNI